MEYIFTDCFDTLISRYEHPYQLAMRWAQCLCRVYPTFDSETIYTDRMKYIKNRDIAVTGIYSFYNQLADTCFHPGSIEDKKKFIDKCIEFELLCEKSTAYVNRKIVDYLRQKRESGAEIYCVTDYHLSSEHMMEILNSSGIGFLIKVFSSASYGATKKSGALYSTVLEILGVSPKDCLMIGDNVEADIRAAKRAGIHTKYYANELHKTAIRLRNKTGISAISLRNVGKKIWETSNSYTEFAVIFFTFCSRLYMELAQQGADEVVFLAREGFFLQKCFDQYQELCVPKEERIRTAYLKCSRRAIHSVQEEKCLPSFFKSISPKNYLISIGFSEEETQKMLIAIPKMDGDKVVKRFGDSDEARVIWEKYRTTIEKRLSDNKDAFDKYIHNIIAGNRLFLVDVGWIGRMQQGIETLFRNINTHGYYIGIYQNLFEPPYVKRQGLIFNKSEEGRESKYFNILRSNIQFYEQLLAAPHGSACFYQIGADGEPYVVEKWDAEEERLYKEVIVYEQNKLMNVFRELCTYTFDGINDDCYRSTPYNRELARIMLRSCLVQSEERLLFMKRLIKGFTQNFQQQSTGMSFSLKGVDGKFIDFLIHPDRSVRYVSKLGVVLDKKGWGKAGRALMKTYYYWTKLLIGL